MSYQPRHARPPGTALIVWLWVLIAAVFWALVHQASSVTVTLGLCIAVTVTLLVRWAGKI
jgi:membrane protease YdiL (CAAX protease family)